jgi:hypothetical protein
VPPKAAAPKAPAPKPTPVGPATQALPAKDGKAPAVKTSAPTQGAKATEPPKAATLPPKATTAPAEGKGHKSEADQVPEIVNRVLATPGQPLDSKVRFEMEGKFGHSFSDVRIHDDSLAAESARAVYAHAYTVGQHIVFDAGQYRPSTPEGRQLLAHELTHTIQQHGLQRSPSDIGMETTGEYHHLEREAESVSRAVMQRPGPMGAPASPGRSGSPVLSRAAKSKTPAADAEDKAKGKEEWVDVDEKSDLGQAGVKQILRSDSTPGLIAVRMSDPFEIPAEKGPGAKNLWEAQATANALQAVMAPGSNESSTSTALKQERPDTDKLRDLWLLKLHWNKTSAEALWRQSAKTALGTDDDASFDPTRANKETRCDVDHIVELQFGGNNVPNNIQMLDSSPNRSSGSQIGQFLKKTSVKVRNALNTEAATLGKPKPDAAAIRLEFKSVTVAAGAMDLKCVKVETAASKIALTAEQQGGSKGKPYPMKSGGFDVCVFVENESETDIDLAESSVAENKAASTLVPGLKLKKWTRPKNQTGQPQCGASAAAETEKPAAADAKPKSKAAKGKADAAAAAAAKAGGTVHATLDPTSRILGPPLKMDEKATVQLERSSSGVLSVPNKDPKVPFIIDYLSKGTFHKLQIGADGSVSGAGSIVPSVPFLPNPFQVEFDKNRFAMTTDVKKPKLPFPVVEFTEAKVGLQIAPEFKPEGKVGFRVAPGGVQVLHGELTVSADATGLVVEGDVFATIPGVDEAKGHLELRDHKWSGGVEIKSGDFGGKLKYVKNGQVSITFTEAKGIEGKGSVDLEVPGVADPVQASVSYSQADGWVYRAKAKFNPPRIDPVEIDLVYKKGHLSGTGETGIQFSHIGGRIRVSYEDEKFSGTGTLTIKTERANGELKIIMKPREEGPPKFTGEGHISYQVTPNLIASAGIKIDEHEKVQIDGELAFPKPIDLFDGFHGDYKIFSISLPIPIPGASIGNVGLEAVITGALSAGYDVGPVQLLNTKAQAKFQPLEPNPQLEMEMTSRLHIPASVHVTGSISGDIKLEAYIASISGGLTVSATATLGGAADLSAQAHYKDGKIQADVDFQTLLALTILLALTAHVRAEAGVPGLSVSTGKEWQLGEYKYDPGLQFGMKLKKPIHYATGEGLTLPSIDDIDWITPKFDVKDALERVFHAGEKGAHPA